MAAVRRKSPGDSNRKLTCFCCALVVILGLLSGCKSPAPGLKSEFKADRIPSPVDENKNERHDPAQALDDGHTEATSSSLKDLTVPVQKKDKNALALNHLPVDKLLEKGVDSAKHGKSDDAKKAYQEVLRRHPDQPVAHHRLAIIADNEGDFRTAEVHYRAALKSNPSDPDLLSDVGYSYLLQTDYQQGEQYLREAIGLQADHKHALNNLALLYSLKGDYDATSEVLRRANSEQEVDAKLAKLFPNGRPANDNGSESLTSADSTSSTLRAPELRPIQPPVLAQDNARGSDVTAPAASTPPTDSHIPTASFTGHVSSDGSSVPGNRTTIPEQPQTPPTVPAVYSAEVPTVDANPIPQQNGLAGSNWNRVPVSFPGGTRNSVIPAEMQLRSNAPASVSNAVQEVVQPEISARPVAPIPSGERDPLATMPVWPHSPVAQPSTSPVGTRPTAPTNEPSILEGNMSLPTAVTTHISDAQRSALILGMNCGPVTLFPFIDYGPQSTSILENPQASSTRVEQPLVAVPVDRNGVGIQAAPIRTEPHTSLKVDAGAVPVQPRVLTYGAPQYPSTRPGANSAGSLPRTSPPARTQSIYPGDSFQAMP